MYSNEALWSGVEIVTRLTTLLSLSPANEKSMSIEVLDKSPQQRDKADRAKRCIATTSRRDERTPELI